MRCYRYFGYGRQPRREGGDTSIWIPISIIIAAGIIIGGFIGYNEYRKNRQKAPGVEAQEATVQENCRIVTLDGYCPDTGEILEEIPVWKDIEERDPTTCTALPSRPDMETRRIFSGKRATSV